MAIKLCIHGYQFDCDQCHYPPAIIALVIESAKEVYKELGGHHSEAVYENALDVELFLRSCLPHRRQVPCAVEYKGRIVGTGFIDILIGDFLVVEIKAIAKLSTKDEQQVRKYMTATGANQGLLVNFGPELEIVQIHPVECYINDDPNFTGHICKGDYE